MKDKCFLIFVNIFSVLPSPRLVGRLPIEDPYGPPFFKISGNVQKRKPPARSEGLSFSTEYKLGCLLLLLLPLCSLLLCGFLLSCFLLGWHLVHLLPLFGLGFTLRMHLKTGVPVSLHMYPLRTTSSRSLSPESLFRNPRSFPD